MWYLSGTFTKLDLLSVREVWQVSLYSRVVQLQSCWGSKIPSKRYDCNPDAMYGRRRWQMLRSARSTAPLFRTRQWRDRLTICLSPHHSSLDTPTPARRGRPGSMDGRPPLGCHPAATLLMRNFSLLSWYLQLDWVGLQLAFMKTVLCHSIAPSMKPVFCRFCRPKLSRIYGDLECEIVR
jgi:hypothetical protein